ncbi:MAG: NPCBM/NEW2 domain-containing protein, partial [bacterium]
MKRLFGALVCLLLLAGTSWGVEFKADLRAKDAPEHTVWLSSLDLSTMTAGWGRPHIDTSIDGNPIKLNKKVYTHGVGTHAVSDITIDLRGVVTRFQAMVGIDDEVNDQGSLTFSVFADGRSLLETRILKGGDEPFFIDLGLSGVRTLRLHVGNANGNISCDHGDWAGALLWLDPAAKVKPVAITPSPPPALSTAEPIITAKDDTSLRINGPVITGVTPGRPLQFCHPTTGIAPFTYTAENLPAGLQLDPATGIVSGTVATAGEYPVTFTVTSKGEKATRTITIVAGENKVGLTPPMGWNAGYVLGRRAEVSKVKEYADLLVKSGLASRGYQYVILGDGWQGARNAAGELQVNPRFGDL